LSSFIEYNIHDLNVSNLLKCYYFFFRHGKHLFSLYFPNTYSPLKYFCEKDKLEFKFSLGEGFDFEGEFGNLIKPLLDEKLLIKEEDKFILTVEGKKRVDKVFSSMRYHQSK